MTPPRHGAVILLGGTSGTAHRHGPVSADVVIAVESGLEQARDMGLRVDLFVGDFDSTSEATLQQAVQSGIRVVRYPAEAGRSNLELALQKASELEVDAVTVVVGGARVDHALTNVAVLANPAWRQMQRRMFTEDTTLSIVHDEDLELRGRPGETVSLIPIGGPVTSVTTMGLRHALTDAALSPFASRGADNEMASASAVIAVRGGILAVVQSGSSRSPTPN